MSNTLTDVVASVYSVPRLSGTRSMSLDSTFFYTIWPVNHLLPPSLAILGVALNMFYGPNTQLWQLMILVYADAIISTSVQC